VQFYASKHFTTLKGPLLGLAMLASVACGGEEPRSGGGSPPGGEAVPEAGPAMTLEAPVGAIDTALAARGEAAFQARACVGCHKIGGGRLTGPDLKGATDRRSFGWIVAMITNPDSMLKNDPTARQLFAEYGTPMANMSVPPDEARALYEYLRRESQ